MFGPYPSKHGGKEEDGNNELPGLSLEKTLHNLRCLCGTCMTESQQGKVHTANDGDSGTQSGGKGGTCTFEQGQRGQQHGQCNLPFEQKQGL